MKLASLLLPNNEVIPLINKIKEYRQKNNMTQQRLAQMAWVSARTIISLESGRFNPSLMLAYRIACIFNTTVDELFCLEENLVLEDEKHEKLQL